MTQTDRPAGSSSTGQVPTFRPPPSGAQRAIAPLVFAVSVMGFVGVVIGISMAFHRTPADCPNGKYFPNGTTDFTCYSHPHAGAGTGIALLSAVLVLLTILVGVVGSKLLTELDELHSRSR